MTVAGSDGDRLRTAFLLMLDLRGIAVTRPRSWRDVRSNETPYSKELFAFSVIKPKVMQIAQSAMTFGDDRDQVMPPIRSSVSTKANTVTNKLTKMPGMNNLIRRN